MVSFIYGIQITKANKLGGGKNPTVFLELVRSIVVARGEVVGGSSMKLEPWGQGEGVALKWRSITNLRSINKI